MSFVGQSADCVEVEKVRAFQQAVAIKETGCGVIQTKPTIVRWQSATRVRGHGAETVHSHTIRPGDSTCAPIIARGCQTSDGRTKKQKQNDHWRIQPALMVIVGRYTWFADHLPDRFSVFIAEHKGISAALHLARENRVDALELYLLPVTSTIALAERKLVALHKLGCRQMDFNRLAICLFRTTCAPVPLLTGHSRSRTSSTVPLKWFRSQDHILAR